jgi:polysaccharide transporter, PST family
MSLSTALRWSSAQTVIRMALGLVSAKASAIYLGPPGVALVAQIGNLIQVAQGTIGNGAQTAVVKLTAVRQEQREPVAVLWSTALRMVMCASLIYIVVSASAARALSNWLLSSEHYSAAIILSSLVVGAAVIETVVVSALNGLKRIDLVAKASIASTLFEVLTYTLLVAKFGLWGGLYGISAVYVAKLMATLIVAFGSKAVRARDFRGPFSRSSAQSIAAFYPMLLAQSIALPMSQILVRNTVIDRLGLDAAGYLQAVWRLSDMYVSVFTTALGMFFIAHYSSLRDGAARGQMLRRTVIQVVLLTASAAAVIYLFRYLVFELVLSRQFLPAADLLPMQLCGDVFKMAAYVMQMTLVAEGRATLYVAIAVGAPAIYVILTWLLLPSWLGQAAPIAYATSHLVAFTVLGLAFQRVASK